MAGDDAPAAVGPRADSGSVALAWVLAVAAAVGIAVGAAWSAVAWAGGGRLRTSRGVVFRLDAFEVGAMAAYVAVAAAGGAAVLERARRRPGPARPLATAAVAGVAAGLLAVAAETQAEFLALRYQAGLGVEATIARMGDTVARLPAQTALSLGALGLCLGAPVGAAVGGRLRGWGLLARLGAGAGAALSAAAVVRAAFLLSQGLPSTASVEPDLLVFYGPNALALGVLLPLLVAWVDPRPATSPA